MYARVERFLMNLSKKSGYSYEFLEDVFNEVFEEEAGAVDMDYFVRVTMERDW